MVLPIFGRPSGALTALGIGLEKAIPAVEALAVGAVVIGAANRFARKNNGPGQP